MKILKKVPVEQLGRRKCILKNHMTSKVEQFKRRKYNQRNHMTLKEGVKKRKNHREFRNKKSWKLF
jgi:hypothetical protein